MFIVANTENPASWRYATTVKNVVWANAEDVNYLRLVIHIVFGR